MKELDLFQVLIVAHAFGGGLALLAGLIAMATKKGGYPHRKSGLIFYFSMVFSVSLALIISILPGHESPFLFAIGVFSLYLVLAGRRALSFKKPGFKVTFDRALAFALLITGIAMIAVPLISQYRINIILTVFGGISIGFAVRDLLLFRDLDKLRKSWLKLHLTKMMGGLIAATTAFFVVNGIIPGIWGWFVPTIIGSIFISIWITKLRIQQ